MKSYSFLFGLLVLLACKPEDLSNGHIQTVTGSINSHQLGNTLIHEHVLVDFIGADSTNKQRWNKEEVTEMVLPYLLEIKEQGFKSLVECTPAYLGRDPELLKILSEKSGIQILSNTGYYGARQNKFLPAHAFSETADQLAQRWIDEWQNGIDGTGIKPGFIKIGVDPGSLSEIHRKLVKAAAITHLSTGLTIAAHTGPAVPAMEELEELNRQGVSPEAFIWVHAQNEKDLSQHLKAAKMGAWVSLDNLSEDKVDQYVSMVKNLRDQGLLNRTLVSHDAGWYSPGEEKGGNFRPYATFQDHFVPALLKAGFSESEIQQLLVDNPIQAFSVKIRKL